MKTEKFIVKLPNVSIEVINKGIALFSEQNPQSIIDLKEHLKSEVKNGIESDWFPYANFESSITWKIIK